MSNTSNLALVGQQYAVGPDRPPAHELMAEDVVWDITPGFPRGGVYNGLDSVLRDFLAPLAELFAEISAHAGTMYETDDDRVVVLGDYHVQSRDGAASTVRFVHVWTIHDHKLTHLHQVADSVVIAAAQHA